MYTGETITREEPVSYTHLDVYKRQALHFDEKQQALMVSYNSEAGQMVNHYIPGDERSFTIIAWPIPEIGGNYEEIFQEIVKINNLDYHLYQGIQQKLIDALDEGEAVYIKGAGENRTEMYVQPVSYTHLGRNPH